MTNSSAAHSLRVVEALPGSAHTQPLPADYKVPATIVSELGLATSCGNYPPAERRALSRAKHEGYLEAIPSMAERALAALEPVENKMLIDRLTLLGMSMANGMDNEMVRAWLHETARLLGDLPQSVLFDAIDDCVKEPGRSFLPSVGEIREKAANDLHRRERIAANLNALARLIREGVEVADYVPPASPWGMTPTKPVAYCTGEEAARIMKEEGLGGGLAGLLADKLKQEPEKTRADYIAEGREPPLLVTPKSDPWEMMP